MKRAKLAFAFAAAFLALAFPGTAQAAFGLQDLGLSFHDPDGSLATEAGTHPGEVVTKLGVTTRLESEAVCLNPNTTPPAETPCEYPEGEVRDIRVELPPGFIGDPGATELCSREEFIERSEGRAGCQDASAVGFAALKIEFDAISSEAGDIFIHVPLYNLEPLPGAPAELGMIALNVPITLRVGLTDEPPYRVLAEATNIPQAILFYDSEITIWGNPADPIHDPLRGRCLSEEVAEFTPEPISNGKCPVKTAKKPFLTMPRSCTGPLAGIFSITPWNLGGIPVSEEVPAVPAEGMSGCDALGFSPTVASAPDSATTHSPTGLTFQMQIDDEGLSSIGGTADSDVKKAVVSLPRGFTVNPSAAQGLAACTAQQYAAETLQGGGCPEAAKLGTIEVETPLLEQTIHGSLYQAQPDDPTTTGPGAENPFDALIALYMIVRDPQTGILLKLPGRVDPDAATGRLVTTFDDLPQLPFSNFKVHFREGARAALVTPARCGNYAISAALTPWARPLEQVEPAASFQISSGPGGTGCPVSEPFAPKLTAGTLNNDAGAHSQFDLRITRGDSEQAITSLSTLLPKGLTGKIAGVAKCTDAALAAAMTKSGRQELAAPSCPAGSQLGVVEAGAGVGPELTYVSGSVYLAGPYRGNPLSVAVVTPAVAGPFDLGTVLVRVGLSVDPHTAEIRVDGANADPIPRILKGIPLELRDLRVKLNRPNFMLNATSCAPKQITAILGGSPIESFFSGATTTSTASDRYQAANCSRLGFKPKLTLALKGGTKRGDHPAVRSVLTPRAGDANLRRAVVTLPPSEQIDNAHINNPCTRVQFNANACPKASILGRARAFTPLLDEPLEGPVYFRSNGGARELPDIVADLNGIFRFELVGFVDAKNARIRTTFANTPDVPVSKFVLNLYGGKRGLLVHNRNICAGRLRAKLKLIGQNSRLYQSNQPVKTGCKK